MAKQTQKRRKQQWFYRLLFLIAISLIIVGSYQLLRPIWVRYNQDKIRDQLLDNLDNGSDDIIWIDPNDWVNADEEVDFFVPDPSDPLKYIQVSHSSSEQSHETEETREPSDSESTSAQTTEPTQSDGGTTVTATPTPIPTPLPTSTQTNSQGQIALQAIGKLVIDKINVNIPIVTGLSRPTLRYAAAHYEITPMIGDRGITAIFAHRHPDHGRDLNRLNEVQSGDRFQIIREGKTYHYLVQKNVVVEPAGVFEYVFGNYNDDHYVMLVTCDPIPTWQNRMIVVAQLESVTDN